MRGVRGVLIAIAIAGALASPAAGQASLTAAVPPTVTPSVITAAPDPAHPILSQSFQDETDRRSHSALTAGNTLELLVDGITSYPRKYALIQGAQRSIYVSTMSWYYDTAGKRVADELIAAVGRGADARAICDGLMADPRIVRRLRDGGVKVARFNLPWPFYDAAGREGRLHHKVMVADLSRGIVGGMNIGDKWALGDGLNDREHDVDVAVDGYAAAEVARRFLELFRELAPQDPGPAQVLATAPSWTQPQPVPPAGQAGFARQIYSEPDKGDRAIEDYYARAFGEARTQIVWYSMSLFPTSPLWSDLRAAAARGVRVVIISQSERAMMMTNIMRWFQFRAEEWWARNWLRGSNVEIWEIDVPLHAKAMTVDGVLASVGSFNNDAISTDANTEGTIVTYDPALVRAVEQMQERDLLRARRVQ